MPTPLLKATFLAVWLALSLGAAADGQTAAKPQYGAWGFDLTAMDPSVKPGDDFNRYANGAWLDRTTIPDDKSAKSLRYDMSDLAEARLHDLMRAAAAEAGPAPRTTAGKMGAFYKAFMDERRIAALGTRPLAPELAAIRAARNRDDVTALMGQANSDFYATIFSLSTDVDLKNVARYAVYATQAGLGLPDRDYYLQPSFAIQKAAYQAYVGKLLGLIGWPDPAANAKAVVDFETRVAEASWTRAQQREVDKTYNPMDRAGLAAMAPGFAWNRFLAGAGLAGLDRLVVSENTAFPKIAAVYAATPVDTLKAWQAFSVADNTAFYLPPPFAEARFEFRDKTLSGQPRQQDRWKRAVHAVSGGDCYGDDRIDCFGNMGFGVGQVYVARYFPPTAKAKIETLVANVKAAMRTRLQQLDWMTPATKAEALKKLDTYQIKVGYPDHFRDFSGLAIRSDDLIGDVRRSGAWDWRFHTGRLDGPVDRWTGR
jgi:putative endopeptidase